MEFRTGVGILRTCRLIHREAFDILYRENLFIESHQWWPLTQIQFPRVINAIQKLFIDSMSMQLNNSEVRWFLKLVHHYGNPSIICNSLYMGFWLKDVTARRLK